MDAVIQRFEFTFELMWKVLKDYKENIGFSDFPQGPRGVLKFAFKNGIIFDENTFCEMIDDRKSTTHIYDENKAKEIYERIKCKYLDCFEKILKYLEKNRYLQD